MKKVLAVSLAILLLAAASFQVTAAPAWRTATATVTLIDPTSPDITVPLGETVSMILQATVSGADARVQDWLVPSGVSHDRKSVVIDSNTIITTTFYYTPAATGITTFDIGYDPNRDYVPEDFITFNITAEDVSTPNQPPTAPVIDPELLTVNEDLEGSLPNTFTFESTDPDDDPITFSVSGATLGTVTLDESKGTGVYTPFPNEHGTDSFEVTASDGLLEASTTVNVTINSINDLPEFTSSDAYNTLEDTPVTITPEADDVEDGALTAFTFESASGIGPNNGTVSPSSGSTFTYTPDPGFAGFDSFVISTTDNDGGKAEQTITVTVTEVNDPPYFTSSDAYTVDEDTPLTFTPTAEDPDADPLTFGIDSHPDPSKGAISLSGTVYTFIPANDYNSDMDGNVDFVIDVTDGINTATQTVSVTVNPVNDRPVTEDDYGTTPVDQTISIDILANDSDVDGDILTVTTVTDGTVRIDGGITYLDYTSATAGTYEIVYTVTDNSGADNSTASGSVFITATEVSDTFIYLSLGDSIPAGISYEDSTSEKIIESYSDKMYGHLLTEHSTVEYHDLAVTGYNMVDLYNQVNQSANESVIRDANLISICIGANDIMDAAPEVTTGRDFYNVNWSIADDGLDAVELYWDDIINRLYSLNPDVEILVMNTYNPYRTYDTELNATPHSVLEANGRLTMHELVDHYLYNDTIDLDSDGTVDYGLNHVIENPADVYDGFSHTYEVVNIYDLYETNDPDKNTLVAFYDNYGYFWFFRIEVQDPHPTQAGQEAIFIKFRDAYLY